MGSSEVIQIRVAHHRRLLETRAVERVIELPDFEEAYESANPQEKLILQSLINSLNVESLKRMIRQLTIGPLETLSYRQLRELCKQHNIFRWSRLDKDEMMEALRAVRVQASRKPVDRSSTTAQASGHS